MNQLTVAPSTPSTIAASWNHKKLSLVIVTQNITQNIKICFNELNFQAFKTFEK